MTMSITYANYLPCTFVKVTLLTENFLWLLWVDSLSKAICLSVNASCFGQGRSTISLLSMEITIQLAYLWQILAHTTGQHVWISKISVSKHGSDIIGSIKATMLSAFHNFHAWKHKKKIEILSINKKTYKKQALEV